jgi:hypothetical protein
VRPFMQLVHPSTVGGHGGNSYACVYVSLHTL